MKNKIKALVFDIGGVVCLEPGPIYPILSKKFNIDLERFRKIRKRYHYHSAIGKISRAEYYRLISNDLKIKDSKELAREWDSLLEKRLKPNKFLKRILVKLCKNYTLAAFTDVTPNHEIARIKNQVYSYFHTKLTSLIEGVSKPRISFYKILLRKLKIHPSKILLIDDKKENLIPAKKLGMKIILFRNNPQLITHLRRLGINY